MAVVTTFSLDSVKNLDLDFVQTQSDVTSLANDDFVGLGTHNAAHIDGNIFDGAGNEADGFTGIAGTNGSLDQLANGNIAIVSQDADSILFTVLDSTNGNTVVASTDIGDASSSNADVAGLTGGRFVIVNQDLVGADFDIDIRIRNANGTQAVAPITIDTGGGNNDVNASVAALDNGNFAVVWQVDTGGQSEIWRAVFDANGGTVLAATLSDTTGTINRNPSVVAKDDGGFAIVYEDNGFATGTVDITLARYSSTGAFQSFDNIGSGQEDSNPYIARLANGLFAVGIARAAGDNDIDIKLVDDVTGTVLAERVVTGGESIFDEQNFASVSHAGLGKIAAFWTNATDGDIDGEMLAGRRVSVSDGAGDTIIGDDFIDIMTGNGGNDLLTAGENNDTLNGNDGDDFLVGGQGIDQAFGGNNNDTLFYETGDATVAGEIIHGGSGSDRVLVRDNVIFREAVFTSIEEIEFSGPGPNFAQLAGAQLGGGLSNFLVIDGVNGSTDQVRIDLGADTAVNLTNWSFIDWVPGGPDGDRIRIFGDGDNENFIGSSVRDDIDGGDGNNIVNGNLGSDFLSGGAVGGGIDRFVFNTALSATNVDRITDFEIDIDECRLENTIFTGLTNGNLNVNAFVIGAAAADATDRIVYNAANGALFFDVDGLGGVAQVRFATLDAGLALDNLDFIVT